jgi:hypothetical protein
MYGLPLFFRLAWRACTTNRGRITPLTAGRFLLQCLFIPALLLGRVVHGAAFRLDDILFPGYREVVVKEPVYVVGIARSGTTFLHRLLAEDSEHFTTLQFWELILAPSIVERKCLLALGRVDRALGGLGRKLWVKFDAWLLGGFRKIHHISLFMPEGDEWFLMNNFTSAFLIFAFPFMDEVRHLLYFDEEAAPEAKTRIMAYYKTCVQRHLYAHGPEKRLLAKSPSFSAKVDSLCDTFPDAKIACCVRNPYEAVPSFGSLLWFIWGRTPGKSPSTPEMRDGLVEVINHFYRHPMDRLPLLPESRQAFIKFDDLTAAPQDTVTRLYQRLGLDMSPAYAQKLAEEQEKARKYKSQHQYALEHYGLTRQDILEQYRDIFDHYGFNKD